MAFGVFLRLRLFTDPAACTALRSATAAARDSHHRAQRFSTASATSVVRRRWGFCSVSFTIVAVVPGERHLSAGVHRQLGRSTSARTTSSAGDTDFVIDNLTGVETLEYSLDSGSEGRHHRSQLSARGRSICRMVPNAARRCPTFRRSRTS